MLRPSFEYSMFAVKRHYAGAVKLTPLRSFRRFARLGSLRFRQLTAHGIQQTIAIESQFAALNLGMRVMNKLIGNADNRDGNEYSFPR